MRRADRLVVLDHGRIVEEGTRAEPSGAERASMHGCIKSSSGRRSGFRSLTFLMIHARPNKGPRSRGRSSVMISLHSRSSNIQPDPLGFRVRE